MKIISKMPEQVKSPLVKLNSSLNAKVRRGECVTKIDTNLEMIQKKKSLGKKQILFYFMFRFLIYFIFILFSQETTDFFTQFDVVSGPDLCEFMIKKLDKKKERLVKFGFRFLFFSFSSHLFYSFSFFIFFLFWRLSINSCFQPLLKTRALIGSLIQP
jgi:hypothetical protein